MLKVQDLINGINISEISKQIIEYSDDYIADCFEDIAKRNTGILYSDIESFICQHLILLEKTINDYGWSGFGCDIHKAGLLAEIEYHERKLYEEMSKSLLYYAYDYLFHQDIFELTEEQNEKLKDFVKELRSYDDKLSDISDFINDELFKNVEVHNEN